MNLIYEAAGHLLAEAKRDMFGSKSRLMEPILA